jgi:hypothetical protein
MRRSNPDHPKGKGTRNPDQLRENRLKNLITQNKEPKTPISPKMRRSNPDHPKGKGTRNPDQPKEERVSKPNQPKGQGRLLPDPRSIRGRKGVKTQSTKDKEIS